MGLSAAAQALEDQWRAATRDLRKDPGNREVKAQVRQAYEAFVNQLERDHEQNP